MAAFNAALEEEATTVTLKHLQQRALCVAQCQNMLFAISEGEKQLSETETDRAQLRAALGLGLEPEATSNSGSDLAKNPNEDTTKLQRSKARVGKRKAHRDKIGVDSHAQ